MRFFIWRRTDEMKTGTLDKMKFMVLKNRLQLPRYVVIGLLEGLWYLTATNAQTGDVGRFKNTEIAAWLEWPGDADQLIEAFCEAGFLDTSEKHRLIVHDWCEHAPDHLKSNLKRWGKTFAKDNPSDAPMDDPEDSPMDDPPDQTRPDPVKPDQTKPSSGPGVLKSGPGVFGKLQEVHLKECQSLDSWFVFATTQAKRPLFPFSEANRLRVFAAAERAIEESETPLKLFKFIVGKEKWGLITTEQETRAAARIKRLQQNGHVHKEHTG